MCDGGDPTVCAGVEQRQVQRHDGPCDAFRGVGRVALGSFGPFLGPGGMTCLIAIPPLGAPTFRAGQLPTDVLDVVFGQIGVNGLLTAWFLALGHGRGLWELMGSLPRYPLFSMSWHKRWRVPGSLQTWTMDSLCTRHTWSRQSRCTQERESVSQQPSGSGLTTSTLMGVQRRRV